MTTTEPTLLDYTPSQDEEIARLKKLAETRNAQVEAIMNDPVFAQAEAHVKEINTKMKTLEKIRAELNKITTQLEQVNALSIEEPVEEGLYILTQKEIGYRRDGGIRTRKSLLLKVMGEWFDLSEGNNSLPNWNGKAITFDDFLAIDPDVIEVTLVKYEATSKWPYALLKDAEEEADDLADTTTPDDESGTDEGE